MQIIRVPAVQTLAKLQIAPVRYGGTAVRAVMSISTEMQSRSEFGEFPSVEEAELAGMAWAREQYADLLVIEGGAN